MDIFLITGAASDIASNVIHLLGAGDTRKVVIALDKDPIDVSQYKKYSNMEVIYCECDLANRESIINTINYMKEEDFHPNYIIHFAAMKYRFDSIRKFDYYRTNKDMQIQVLSISEICKVCLPDMIKKRNGKVLFMISSVTDGEPPNRLCQYTMVKYALLGLMKSIAVECKGKNVSVCGLSPEMVNTKFLSEIDERILELNAMKSINGKLLEAEDIAKALIDLLSHEAEELNGNNYLFSSNSNC
ncbi:SDR family oxidoreductase [Clostridium sp. LP20]|uniref:SDR family oxidoreductase n=1 Tax=Clostridium sp. LP20 TaxID=3418665 RepID=UPI003EE72D9F